MKLTHRELVEMACVWLRRQGCVVVMPEPRNMGNIEIPDAIGWTYGSQSILVECKASRTDFKADAKKRHREFGMGSLRYFLAPKGLIHPNEVPPGWGLVEPQGSRFRVVIPARARDPYLKGEMNLLIAEFRSDTPSRCVASRDSE